MSLFPGDDGTVHFQVLLPESFDIKLAGNFWVFPTRSVLVKNLVDVSGTFGLETRKKDLIKILDDSLNWAF